MEFNVDQMVCKLSCPGELSGITYFKQFNIYDNILLDDINRCINDIDVTIPKVDIYFVKVIDTKKGVSLEGQYLSGKKLIVLGNIFLNLVINYYADSRKNNCKTVSEVVNVCLPFSEFIIVPNKLYDCKEISIRYLIEDVTTRNLCDKKIFISVTMLIQYLDEK